MIEISKALRFINEQHDGYLAFVTDDGLVFRSEMVDTCKEPESLFGIHNDTLYGLIGSKMDGATVSFELYDADRVIEDFAVFPIVDGKVDLRALRDHMGY